MKTIQIVHREVLYESDGPGAPPPARVVAMGEELSELLDPTSAEADVVYRYRYDEPRNVWVRLCETSENGMCDTPGWAIRARAWTEQDWAG